MISIKFGCPKVTNEERLTLLEKQMHALLKHLDVDYETVPTKLVIVKNDNTNA